MNVNAQNNNKNQHELSLGAWFMRSEYKNNNPTLGVSYTYSRVLFDRLGIGVSTGLNYISESTYGGSNNNLLSIPVNLDIRALLPLCHTVSFIPVVTGGLFMYGINSNRTDTRMACL